MVDTLRPMQVSDASEVSAYFAGMDEATADTIGFSYELIKDAPSRNASFWEQRTRDGLTQNMLMWLVDGVVVGYSALNNIKKGEEAEFHLHILRKENRGKGLGSRFVPLALKYFFESEIQPQKIIIKPQSNNVSANKLLARICGAYVASIFEEAHGPVKAMHVNRYEISRAKMAL